MRSDIQALFVRALESTHGVKVACHGDPTKVKQLFYRERKKARDKGINAYDCLKFETSPQNPDGEIWITKQEEPQNGQS